MFDRDILITSVMFGQENTIRIEFMNMMYSTERGGVESALVLFDNEEANTLTMEIQEALAEIVESYMRSCVRNPGPETLPKNRFLRRDDDDSEEDSSDADSEG